MTYEQALDHYGYIVFPVKGVSMLPLLRQKRDLVNVVKMSGERCKKYDTVLFQRTNGDYVLHRITKVYDDGFWIVGDNTISGEYVFRQQVLGIMTEIRRSGKTIYVDSKSYKLYVMLWRIIYPIKTRIRQSIYTIKRSIKRILCIISKHK